MCMGRGGRRERRGCSGRTRDNAGQHHHQHVALLCRGRPTGSDGNRLIPPAVGSARSGRNNKLARTCRRVYSYQPALHRERWVPLFEAQA